MKPRVPSLDGLRAVGLSCVLISHAALNVSMTPAARFWLSDMAYLALSVFFFISGLLITRLLLADEDEHGSIDLRRYYFRRFFRIVPPLYLYLVAVAVLGVAGWREIAAAAGFVFSYFPSSRSSFLAHTWTLSIEEQFYVFWPLVLVAAGRKRALRIAVVLIALAPLFRVGQWLLFPHWRWMVDRALHTRIDSLMSGCCVALLQPLGWFAGARDRILRPAYAYAAAFFLMAISPALHFRFAGLYHYVVGYTLETVAIAVLVMYLVHNPRVLFARFLNWKPVVHVGLISYSVYLWQQLCLVPAHTPIFSPSIDNVVRSFPLNIVLALAAGELSYRTIEAWSQRARRSLQPRPSPALAAAAGD